MFKEMNTLKPFFNDPQREFGVREAAKLLKISPATASKELKFLEKDGFLQHRKERLYDFYRANLESHRYRDLKIYYNISRIRESGLIEALNKFYFNPKIILFGSTSRGFDTKDSDIDIVVIDKYDKPFPSADFAKKLGKELHVLTIKNFKGLRNPHLADGVLNGIILQGEIEWTLVSAQLKDM